MSQAPKRSQKIKILFFSIKINIKNNNENNELMHHNKMIGAYFACDGTTLGVSPSLSCAPFFSYK